MNTDLNTILEAPCAFCGYNGANYWQGNSHAENCPWHKIGGEAERAGFLRKIVNVRQLVVDSLTRAPQKPKNDAWCTPAVASTWPEGSVVLVRLTDTIPTRFPNPGARYRRVQYWMPGDGLPSMDPWLVRNTDACLLLETPKTAPG